MKAVPCACVLGAITLVGVGLSLLDKPPQAPPGAGVEIVAGAEVGDEVTDSLPPPARLPPPAIIPEIPDGPIRVKTVIFRREPAAALAAPTQQQLASLEEVHIPVRQIPPVPVLGKRDLSYLAYYAYAEIPMPDRPADLVLDSLKDVPLGTPVEEIKRASDAFGLDFNFMKAVAKIESDFDPKQRTGSYIGLFQLSKGEFAKYGSGDILNPRDNAVAAAYKFLTEGILFEWLTHRKPSLSDLYLIHQQGWEGAGQHINHPERIAWESMCATSEGKEKGEQWCKRAIWGNTLPTIKSVWKSVDKLTSAAFVTMWRDRVAVLYARYSQPSQAVVEEAKH